VAGGARRGESYVSGTLVGGIDARCYTGEVLGELFCASGVYLHFVGHCRVADMSGGFFGG
jgi:hypothetical protein